MDRGCLNIIPWPQGKPQDDLRLDSSSATHHMGLEHATHKASASVLSHLQNDPEEVDVLGWL